MKKKFTVKSMVILGIIVLFIFSYVRQMTTMNRIQDEIANKQTQLEELKEKNSRLEDEVEKINSDSQEYLEKLARERLGMIRPGEKVVNSENKESDSN